MLVLNDQQKRWAHDLDHAFFIEEDHSPGHERNEDHLLVFGEVCKALGFVAVKQVVRGDRPLEVDCAYQKDEC